MAEQDFDRNEAATPYKLEKAREKGQVGKSSDVVTAVVFTLAAAWLNWKGWDGVVAMFTYAHSLLARAARVQPSAAALWDLVGGMVREVGMMFIPFFGALVVGAILANVMQTGPVLSFEPVKPDFSRLNPAAGLKRVFSKRTLFEALRTVLKLALMGIVVYSALKALFPQFFQLSAMPTATLARTIVSDAAAIALKLSLLLCIVASLDYGYTRREYANKMKMSRRELKDEHKHREGDPRIRSRLRELRRETLKRTQSVHNTAKADVVITNPTHYAVALRYEHGQMQSPQLVAKGTGSHVAAMRQIAARHRIPVVQSPPLAREIYKTLEIDHFVPPALYGQVARILVWIYAMRDAKVRGAAA